MPEDELSPCEERTVAGVDLAESDSGDRNASSSLESDVFLPRSKQKPGQKSVLKLEIDPPLNLLSTACLLGVLSFGKGGRPRLLDIFSLGGSIATTGSFLKN